MKCTSILNDVLGPVMRGPSSSHTAASYHLAVLLRSLIDDEIESVDITFDADGSYGRVYRVQGSDLAFAAGLMGWPITDARFPRALEHAAQAGIEIRFALEDLPEADHPNTVRIALRGRAGRTIDAAGASTGGGSIEITTFEGWPVMFTGRGHEIAVETDLVAADEVAGLLLEECGEGAGPARQERGGKVLITSLWNTPPSPALRSRLEALPGVHRLWMGEPVFFVRRGAPLFASAEEMIAAANDRKLSLGETALAHEAEILGLFESDILVEMVRRLEIMRASVHDGLADDPPSMQLLRPTAAKVFAAEAAGKTAVGGLHTRAAARAMAAMHVNCGMGVVCAAPTAGSAGVLPGVLTTLLEERNAPRDAVARALLAAGAIGVVLAERATFAAEIAGCQVEIGAAGAMAAAAVVDFAGGTAAQAADAAAISFQNTMGSVCDLVQGIVEIPCHTRNAAAASSAFVCADLILGGYENPIPLDDTIDAVYAVGKMLPPELKVTALGGLADTPSARKMKRLR
jgi:L-serine dehydratase